MIGVSIFNLPNSIVKYSYEDSWISIALGAIYPLFEGFLAIYIIKKHPKENILSISRKYFGKIVGSIMNFVFLLYFILYCIAIVSGFTNIYGIYATSFLKPIKIILIFTALGAYTAYKGLKALGRVNTIAFFVSLGLIISGLGAFKKGSFLNLRPVFGSGILNIIIGTKETFSAYTGLEIVLLIYPRVKDISNVKKAIFGSVAITAVVYTFSVFITMYYLGADIITKSSWSFITVSESVDVPLINNFRYLFTFIWIGVALKVLSNYYFAAVFIINSFWKKLSRRNATIAIYIIIIILILTLQLSNEVSRRNFLDLTAPKMAIFVIVYPLMIAIFTYFKRNEKNET
jgi:spore germination protein (amino acid permease)